jgi:hypothetical protein
MPEPQASEARFAAAMQELSAAIAFTVDAGESFCLTHGSPYFQATKTTAIATISLTSREVSMT